MWRSNSRSSARISSRKSSSTRVAGRGGSRRKRSPPALTSSTSVRRRRLVRGSRGVTMPRAGRSGRPPLLGRGQQVRHPHGARRAVGLRGHDRQRVEPVQRDRRQVLRLQRLVAETRGHEAQRAEAQAPGRRAGFARDVHPACVAHRDALDPAGAVDQHADAPVELATDRRHLPGQLVAHDGSGRKTTPVQTLQPVLLGRRQPQEIPVKCRNRRSLLASMYVVSGGLESRRPGAALRGAR